MGAVVLVVCLAGLAWLVVTLLRGEKEAEASTRATLAAEPEVKAVAPAGAPPRPSLWFVQPATPLVVDGHLLATDGAFGGVVELEPGEHVVETATHTARCSLTPGSLTVIDFSSGEPEFLDPTVGELMVQTLLRRAPPEAVVKASQLHASPTPAEALRAARSSLDVLDAVLSSAPARSFGDDDLAALERAFAAWRGGGDLGPYVEALRSHYIRDVEMARQASHFARYAERVVAQVREAPALAAGEPGRYLRYLAQDLQDTKDEALAAHGRALAALLESTS